MAADITIKYDHKAIDRLLKEESLPLLEDIARSVQTAAGPSDDYEVDSEIGPHRARASVRTVSIKAMIDETTSHPLLRALDAGRR